MIVRELISRFGFNVDQGSVNKVESSINRLSGMLSALAAFASLRALAGIADSMQSLEARIGMLPQTISDAGDAFDTVAKHASDARQSVESYASLYTKVGNASKDVVKTQEDLLTVTDTISKALVVGGATAQEQSSAMLQFAQALGSGVLQGDEFRAMAEAAPQYLDALAEALGYPRSELKKLASQGLITTKAVIEATLKMSEMFDSKFKQMPMTIGQATTIMSNRWSVFIARMNRESLIVTKVADLLLTAFDKIESGLKSMNDFFGGATNTLKFFGIALAALLAPAALGGLITAFGAIFSVGGAVVAGLLLIGLALEDVYQWVTGGDSIIGDWLGSWEEVGPSIMRFLNPVIDFVKSFINVLSGQFKIAWGFLTLDSDMMMEGWNDWYSGVTGIFSNLITVFKNVGLAIIDAFGFAFDKLNDLFVYFFWTLPTGWIVKLAKFVADKFASIFSLDKFAGDGSVDFKQENSPLNISKSSISNSATGGAGTTIDNRQTVNVTVPQGTPEAQQKFLQQAAAQTFGDSRDKQIARQMGAITP